MLNPVAAYPRSFRSATGLAAIAALTLTACGQDEDPAEFQDADPAGQTDEGNSAQENPDQETDADESEETGSEEDSSAENTTGEEEATDDDASAADREVDLGEPVQTMTVPLVEGQGEVTIGLHTLVHEGDTMALSLSFTPSLSEEDELSIRDMFNLPASQEFSLMPYLNDRENLKRYSVLGTDYVESGWQSPADQPIPDGEPGYYWAYFAAPEDEIDTLSVAVLPSAPEFEGVEITRSGADDGGGE